MTGTPPPVRIAACDCLTPLGNTRATLAALLAGTIAWRPTPVLGRAGGDLVPLALMPERALNETLPPSWMPFVHHLLAPLAEETWGTARRPVIVTSSNFGVGHLYEYRSSGELAHLRHGIPFESVKHLQRELGWGPNVTSFSHACVTAHLGLWHATQLLTAGLADDVLVFSFDFVSPFVAGGFHALKILNGAAPAPYQDRAVGSVALGDGLAYAVLTRDRGSFTLLGQALHNEMHHFTANRADGAGFRTCIEQLDAVTAGRRLWLKGHGTGTLEAGRLEAEALTKRFPGAPLVSWKGSLGHTLGSCGLVELALALAAMQGGRAPGTVGSEAPGFAPEVAFSPVELSAYDAALCTSNAFGGAHAALLVAHA
jgi:hypothetical protein